MSSIGFVTCDKLMQYDEFREDEVIQILERFLVNMGYTIIYEGKRQGPDIVAYRNGSLLIIEARGIPSKYKVRGRDKGKPKSIDVIKGQFWGWPAEVITELIEREYEWYIEPANWAKVVLSKIGQKVDAKYIAVIGYHKEYINVLEKRKHALKRLGYEIWLIGKEGRACKYLAI